MKTLGVLSREGGVGKTTLATHLAVLGDQAGSRTLLVDLDPQRSAASWWRARDAATPALVETTPGELRDILASAAEAGMVDLVVVDTRPSAGRRRARRRPGGSGAGADPAGDLRPARHPRYLGYRQGRS